MCDQKQSDPTLCDQKQTIYDLMRNEKIFYDISGQGIRYSAIKSCIETDNPETLAELTHNDKNMQIYALIKCFTFIPATNCITYLISTGISLDDSFELGNCKMTPRQYLTEYFDINSKTYSRAKAKIMAAIEEGMTYIHSEPEEIVIPSPPPTEKKQKPMKRIMTALSLLKRMNTY
jgi:hypothetical protein